MLNVNCRGKGSASISFIRYRNCVFEIYNNGISF
ncbi:hypothetical protein EDC39_10629 [Geothermobacter ehrlichii]|uniref:Uncharacterized protein n=1 Tax=Geothermobacter ehrlichii TaxID=213224 RepID=A0A5D3WIW5_9BACT|nr:hypothetical protein EDC39_10629 [Geothermobacter ehrlichii]